MINSSGNLCSLQAFDDAELRTLAMATSPRAQTDPSRAWRGLWAEMTVLAAVELDRRGAVLHDLDRDAEGLHDDEEIGALLSDVEAEVDPPDDPAR